MGDEDHTIEGVGDDEDGQVTCTELHIRDQLREDLPLSIQAKDSTLRKANKVIGTIATLAGLVLEEEDQATSPVLEDFTLSDDILECMVRGLFSCSEDTEDIVPTAGSR